MQLFSLVVSALVVLSGAAQAREQMLGGYSSTKLTSNLKSLLFTAISKDANYATTVSERVCGTAVQSVSSQVVSGTNYKFVIQGCDVIQALEDQNLATTSSSVAKYLGKCGKTVKAGCTPETITVTVYEQSWTNTLRVSNVEYAA